MKLSDRLFLFDSLHNHYFSAWLSPNDMLLGGLHSPWPGSLNADPFVIRNFSSNTVFLQTLSASCDAKEGNALVVWAESEGDRFSDPVRMRAALVKLE